MPEGIITGAQNADAVATIVAARALPRLKASTVAYSIADPSYAGEVRQHGDTVNVPIPAEFSTNLLADGGTITRQNPSLGNASIVLNKHRELTWEHTDINKALARPDLEGVSAGQAIANFAEDIDEDLLSIYTQFTTTDVGTYDTALTEGVIDTAETTLFDQRAQGKKSLVVTGTGYGSLRQIPRFTEADKIAQGSRPISNGFVGMLKDFMVYRAQKTNVTSSTDRHGVAMVPAALLVAVRPLGVQASDGTVQVELSEDGITLRMTMSYHHEVLGGLTTLDTLYGYVSGRVNHGVEVRH